MIGPANPHTAPQSGLSRGTARRRRRRATVAVGQDPHSHAVCGCALLPSADNAGGSLDPLESLLRQLGVLPLRAVAAQHPLDPVPRARVGRLPAQFLEAVGVAFDQSRLVKLSLKGRPSPSENLNLRARFLPPLGYALILKLVATARVCACAGDPESCSHPVA